MTNLELKAGLTKPRQLRQQYQLPHGNSKTSLRDSFQKSRGKIKGIVQITRCGKQQPCADDSTREGATSPWACALLTFQDRMSRRPGPGSRFTKTRQLTFWFSQFVLTERLR